MPWRYLFIALGATAFLAVNWLLWPRSAPRPEKGKEAQLYLYCPKCHFERTCGKGEESKVQPCPQCDPKLGNVLQVTTESHAGKVTSGPNPYVLLGIIDLNSLLVVAVVVATRLKHRHEDKEENILYYVFKCPTCRRRLRYLDRQVGHEAQCPACKERFIFPEPAGDPIRADELI